MLKGERNRMKVKRINAFRVTALLMLTALAIMSIVPAGASPAWDWIPGTYHFHCQEGSNRTLSICTHPTDTVVTNKTIPYGCKQYYYMTFSEPDAAGNVTITVPTECYHSEPFFLKTIISITTFYVWCQVYMVGDGTGTLATVDDIIDVDVSTIVTGDTGAGNFTTDVTIGDDVPDPAGSALIYMPLNMDVWLGTSSTNPTVIPDGFLFAMPFPMWTTTGFTEVRIIDETPFPSDPPSISMHGFYMNATGVRFNAETGTATLIAAGAGLDIYAYLLGLIHAWTDYLFLDFEVLSGPPPVGGIWIPVDKLALLAPYIGLASTIIVAVAATAIFFKYRKKL